VGVVITAIDPSGAAAGRLVATEIIEAIDGRDMLTPDHWHARVARMKAGELLTLRVRSGEGVRDVQITATAPTPPSGAAAEPSLGLRLRLIPNVGVEVLAVEPQSSAARATIRAGDIITTADGKPAPTPAQIARAFASLKEGESLMVATARGAEHRVLVIEKK
jgi:S1-C subfamily serine protease